MKTKFTLLAALLLAFSTLAVADETDCPNCNPDDPSADVFDANACVGPTLSSQAAADMFCRGANRADIATFKYSARRRTCNTFTKCGAWEYISPEKFVGGYMGNSQYAPAPYLANGGTLALSTSTGGVTVNFVTKGFVNPEEVLNFYSTDTLPSSTATGNVSASHAISNGRSANWLNNGSINSGTNLRSHSIQFTDHCARFYAYGSTSPDSTATWTEYQLGGISRYRPGQALRRYR